MAGTEFYQLPAHRLKVGMSTSDGQDVLTVTRYTEPSRFVIYDAYTPSDDPEQDDENRCEPDARYDDWNELVDLAVFPGTKVDGRTSDCPVASCDSPWCATSKATAR